MIIEAILLLLPVVSQARIDLRFKLDAYTNVEIEYTGDNIDVISDKERRTFGISDEELKDASEVYSGKKPDDVFVRSPTPWNDLYKSYKWSEVTRTLKPVGSRILNWSREPVVIFSQEFINNSSIKAICDATMTNDVSFILQSIWFDNDELEDNQIITCGVQMNASYGDAFFFSTRCGEDLIEERTYTIGLDKNTNVELIPHQKVVAKLTAVRVIVDVEITYLASLNGYVACNYDNEYDLHHFHAYKINNILDAAKKPKQKEFKEVIRIKFYSNANVVVSDVETSKRLVDIDVSGSIP